jgi:hypothetical protein
MRPSRKTVVFLPALLGVAYFYVIPSQPPAQPCAESCSCTPENTDWDSAVNVQCGERNLTSVPIKINDQPVSLLNVSFNDLKTLKEDALSSYESVRYLYLQHCMIFNISEEVFQRLENLTVIDLSNNRFSSISPNLFSGNHKLDKVILRNNKLVSLQENTSFLNGPSSLSFLDLQSCHLSNISSITFSLLINLTFLDISRNKLVLLNPDTLSSHQKLKDVNLKNNPWQCGAEFDRLMCWMHSQLALSHKRTVKCQYLNGTFVTRSPKNRSSLCDSESTHSVTTSHKPGISTSTKLNLASTRSHELDISTGTKLNLESTRSNELDISTGTKLNLASTRSHELDISTGTKLNLASTPSHELDIPTSTTLNPEVPIEEKRVINSILLCVGLILLLLSLCVILFFVCKKYGTQICERVRRLFNWDKYQPVDNVQRIN